MAVNPVVHNAAADSASQSLAGNSDNDLQNNFLTLLIAQLKNQDSTNPMDNSQLTSQLAQISTVICAIRKGRSTPRLRSACSKSITTPRRLPR